MITSHISSRRRSSIGKNNSLRVGNQLASFTIWCELFLLACLGAVALLSGAAISSDWHPLVLTTITGLWLISWTISNKANRTISLPPWPLYLLLSWLPVNLFFVTTTPSSWQACGYLLLGIVLFLTCLHHPWLQEQPWRLTLLLLVLIGGGLALGTPIVQWKSEFRLFYLPIYDWLAMLQPELGETVHANIFAGALVLLLPLAVTLAFPKKRSYRIFVGTESGQSKPLAVRAKQHNWRRLSQISGWLSILLLSTLVTLTQSRGGYLGASFAVLTACLLRWPRLNYSLPAIILGVLLLIQQMGFGRLLEFLGADNTFGGSDVRAIIWTTSLQAFRDFAWTGIGFGAFRQVMPLLYPSPVINNEIVAHAHNLLLQIGLDLGIPGLAAYLLFYGTMVGMAIAVLRRTRSPQATATALGATWDGNALIAPPTVGVTISTGRFMRQLTHLERTRQQHWALAAGCLAALVGMQVHGLLDAVTWGNKLAFLPWLIFAQITLLYRYHTAPPDRPRQEEHEL